MRCSERRLSSVTVVWYEFGVRLRVSTFYVVTPWYRLRTTESVSSNLRGLTSSCRKRGVSHIPRWSADKLRTTRPFVSVCRLRFDGCGRRWFVSVSDAIYASCVCTDGASVTHRNATTHRVDRTCVIPRTHNTFRDESFAAAGPRGVEQSIPSHDGTSAADNLNGN